MLWWTELEIGLATLKVVVGNINPRTNQIMSSATKYASIVLSSLVAAVIFAALVSTLFKIKEYNPLKWQLMMRYYIVSCTFMVFSQILNVSAVISEFSALEANSLPEQAYWLSIYFPTKWISAIFYFSAGGIWIFASFERFKRVFHIEDKSITARIVTIIKFLVVLDVLSAICFYSWYFLWNPDYVNKKHQKLQGYVGASTALFVAIIDIILSILMTHKVLSSLKESTRKDTTIENGKMRSSNEEMHSRILTFKVQLISFFLFLIGLDVFATIALIFLDMSSIAGSTTILHVFLTFNFLNLLKQGVLMVKTPSRVGTAAKASAKIQAVTELPSVRMNSIISNAPADLGSSSKMF